MRQQIRSFLRTVLFTTCSIWFAGCVNKGDTNVNGGQAQGDLPTCANVCGAVTSNNSNWCGCGAYVPKDDREKCITQCEDIGPTEEEFRCFDDANDCSELSKCGQFWPDNQVATGYTCD